MFKRVRDLAITKNDCTCAGIEINLAPLGFASVQRTLDRLLSEPFPHTHEKDTYGMHIHVSTERIADQTIDRALDFMGANPRFMVFVANRDNEWSAVRINSRGYEGRSLRDKVMHKASGYGIYTHTGHKTHEFRMFRTTLNAHIAKANVQFIMSLLRFCVSHTSTDVNEYVAYVHSKNARFPNFCQRIAEEWEA